MVPTSVMVPSVMVTTDCILIVLIIISCLCLENKQSIIGTANNPLTIDTNNPLFNGTINNPLSNYYYIIIIIVIVYYC